MPLPVLPFVVGGAGLALLLTGSKEAKPAKPASVGDANTSVRDGGNVAPTSQSTGGESGGPQAPSHADYYNTAAEPAKVDDAPKQVQETPVAESAPALHTGGPSNPATALVTSAVDAYKNPTADPWAGTAQTAKVTTTAQTTKTVAPNTNALGAIGTVGGLTARAAADSFALFGSSFGAIW